MIYFDNAATTFPKPACVLHSVQSAFQHYGANPGRSGHQLAMETSMKVYECRESVADFFGAQVDEVVFGSNCTHVLNIAIKGILKYGDHVIISDLEHNSVLRPMHTMQENGWITYDVAKIAQDDQETVASFEQHITASTKLIACTHGSNAFGIRVPIEKIGALAKKHGIYFLVDAAQTAGVLPIDMRRMQIDFLCTAGHKSLYGPSGTGLLITPHGEELSTLMEGGTGSQSADYGMPLSVPDRLECGTVNTMGILGLGAGISFIRRKGIQTIHCHEMQVGAEIYRRLSQIPGVILYTKEFSAARNLPVISFNIDGMPSEIVTEKLSNMGFALRGGLHCAPLAHKKMGTLESGTVRISIGAMNTLEQGIRLCTAVHALARSR